MLGRTKRSPNSYELIPRESESVRAAKGEKEEKEETEEKKKVGESWQITENDCTVFNKPS